LQLLERFLQLAAFIRGPLPCVLKLVRGLQPRTKPEKGTLARGGEGLGRAAAPRATRSSVSVLWTPFFSVSGRRYLSRPKL